MFDYVWLCTTMYEYTRLCMPMYDYLWLCMTMFDYIYVWHYMTVCLWGFVCVWVREREEFQPFSYFYNLFRLIHMIQMFSNFSYFSTGVDFVYLCLLLFASVHFCLPLFKWRIHAQILCLFVQLTHIKSTFTFGKKWKLVPPPLIKKSIF